MKEPVFFPHLPEILISKYLKIWKAQNSRPQPGVKSPDPGE